MWLCGVLLIVLAQGLALNCFLSSKYGHFSSESRKKTHGHSLTLKGSHVAMSTFYVQFML